MEYVRYQKVGNNLSLVVSVRISDVSSIFLTLLSSFNIVQDVKSEFYVELNQRSPY